MSWVDGNGEERWEGRDCTVIVRRPADRVVLVVLEGVGGSDLGDHPFHALASDMRGDGSLDLFLDFGETRGTSLDFSSRWAAWLARHRDSFRLVSMLARTKYLQLTADALRRFARFGEMLRVHTDLAGFDAAFRQSVRGDAPTPTTSSRDDIGLAMPGLRSQERWRVR